MGILVGIVFIISGFITKIPREYIYNPTTYVGGDAYNYIIESSIRGGTISGAMTKQAVYIASGAMMILISSFKLVSVIENGGEKNE